MQNEQVDSIDKATLKKMEWEKKIKEEAIQDYNAELIKWCEDNCWVSGLNNQIEVITKEEIIKHINN